MSFIRQILLRSWLELANTATAGFATTGDPDNKAIKYADLLEIHFAAPLGGTKLLTNAPYDITLPSGTPTLSGERTFAADGMWLSASPPSETSEPRVNTISITLSASDENNTYPNIFLNNSYINTRCVIYRQFIADSNNQLVDDPIMMWDGEIVSFKLSETHDSSVLTFNSASVFYDFDTINCRRTNDSSQQQYFPNDKGFEKATQDVVDLAWGKKV
jgi:hypothetical protein